MKYLYVPYQKEHWKWLNLAYLVWTFLSLFLGEGVQKGAKSALLATYNSILAVFRGLQEKIYVSMCSAHKKSLKSKFTAYTKVYLILLHSLIFKFKVHVPTEKNWVD